MDVFEDYFGECSETAIKENFVIVYEVKKLLTRYQVITFFVKYLSC
jgi:hypothetical protein